jgi:TonB family protein
LLPCQVDRGAAGTLSPFYSNQLRAARIGGSVRVGFVVDTLGRARLTDVFRSDHEAFQAGVRNALANARFEPAVRDGRRVRVRREELFVFVAPTTTILPLAYSRDTLPDGTPRTTLGEIARDPRVRPFGDSEALEIQRAVFAHFLRSIAPDSVGRYKPTVCLTLIGGDRRVPADGETLRLFTRPNRPVVRPADCPRTYDAMFAVIGEPGPPAGWVDPYHMRPLSIVRWNHDIALVTFEVAQGTLVREHQCAVSREQQGWMVNCEATSSRIS